MYEENGIIHPMTVPYCPKQIGITERKNRALKKMMDVMLISFGLSHNMWGEALSSTNHVLNRLPHKKLEKTPYKSWKGRVPSYNFLRVWVAL